MLSGFADALFASEFRGDSERICREKGIFLLVDDLNLSMENNVYFKFYAHPYKTRCTVSNVISIKEIHFLLLVF